MEGSQCQIFVMCVAWSNILTPGDSPVSGRPFLEGLETRLPVIMIGAYDCNGVSR